MHRVYVEVCDVSSTDQVDSRDVDDRRPGLGLRLSESIDPTTFAEILEIYRCSVKKFHLSIFGDCNEANVQFMEFWVVLTASYGAKVSSI